MPNQFSSESAAKCHTEIIVESTNAVIMKEGLDK